MQKYKVYINKKCKIVVDNWDSFCEGYIFIEAAGGLVHNNDNQTLMIFRNGVWDLPKGKLEDGESIRDCAIREVEEECGVSDLEILEELSSTYHTYEVDGTAILKRTYWFNMYTRFNKQVVPQISEGITRVEWIDRQDVSQKLKNSYANIRDLINDK